MSTSQQRQRLSSMSRAELEAHQLVRLNSLLANILPANKFYASKLSGFEPPFTSLADLAQLPYTHKDELLPESSFTTAANCTFGAEAYVRYHQTSGTRGRPLPIRDTANDWKWWVDCWQYVLDAAEITPGERAMLAFSFGPFIGFWSAFDALVARGVMAVPGGGMGSLARIDLMERMKTSSLFCTPTYALRLAEVAAEHQIALDHLAVKRVVVAGEPGGSVPSIRQKIEETWKATVIDHAGASEVGPWGVGDREGRGMHIIESEFIAEFVSVASGEPAQEGELSQLVLTSLGRVGCPVIRYRTGDLVRPRWPQSGDMRFVHLEGGVLGRVDDMMVIRGVNIFPTAIEQILRGFPEVVEYRLTARKVGELDALTIEVEDRMQNPQRIAEELKRRLGLKVEVRLAATMSLPRFEGKGQRFIDERPKL
jgi:phenylacetate-CoA ligase